MRYTAFFFDFDYTLADSSVGIVTCFQKVLNRHGYLHVEDEAVKKTIGMTLEDSFARLTDVKDTELLKRLKDEYLAEADLIMSDNTVLYDEVIPLINSLKERGARLGIVSTKQGYIIHQTLSKYGIEPCFDTLVGMLDVRQSKPHPEGLLLAMKQVNALPGDTLYVGDNSIDAMTAQAAGVDFVGVTTGTTSREAFLSYPHKAIVERLSELNEQRMKNEE